MEFAYVRWRPGKGGTVTLYFDGKKVGEGNIPMTPAMVFSADDGLDIGVDTGSPVSSDYGSAPIKMVFPRTSALIGANPMLSALIRKLA
jgi:hypothetical protein